MPIGWKQLHAEIWVHYCAVDAYWNLGDMASAEIEANRLLEAFRMAKRWQANGNTPPLGLGTLLEGPKNGDHS